MRSNYQFFIAGIIQGSNRDDAVYNQHYREIIAQILNQSFPDSDIYCPVENHPDSISYNNKKAKRIFFDHIEWIKKSHGLIVYLPEASLGTGIEMWEAYHARPITITISPMVKNWVVRILSDKICPSLSDFQDFVESGAMSDMFWNKFPIDEK